VDPAALTPDEAELENIIFQSGHECDSCGEALHLTSDVVLVQVVYGHIDESNILTFRPVLNSEGDYGYEPSFLDEVCWDETIDKLREHMEETYGNFAPELCDYSICRCSICSSDIPPWEPCGMSTLGRLQRPKQTPNGESTICFQGTQAPDFYCISCMREYTSSILELWSNLSYHGECEEGTSRRCWRTGECEGGCRYRRGG